MPARSLFHSAGTLRRTPQRFFRFRDVRIRVMLRQRTGVDLLFQHTIPQDARRARRARDDEAGCKSGHRSDEAWPHGFLLLTVGNRSRLGGETCKRRQRG
jgi:hypothetical protein